MFLLFCFIACRYHIQIQTTPAPATIVINDVKYTSKPQKRGLSDNNLAIQFRKIPFKKVPIQVQARGYRTLEQSLQPKRQRLIFHRKNTYHFILIAEHKGAGSWSPEDPLQNP
tara:strand:+ start:194 stop:532 length:339 start_codon:yes stop_codon:yes gene_type:complete